MNERKCINLRLLPLGKKAKILSVEAHGEMNRRIRDMGLIPGSMISIVGRAPLRDPVAVRLSGVTISLRNSEADYIKVETL
ncbi:MAG: ferrous iron transport protein A [Desulfovibrio sp.]|nr:ferrous iron transport protein A [Desulfovibrio sp.]